MCWRRRCPELNRQYIKNTYSIEFWLVIGFFLSVRSLFFASNIFSLLQIYHNIKWNALKPITEKSTPHSNKAWNSFINYLFQLQMKYLTYLNLRCSKNPLEMQFFWNYYWNNTKSQLPHTIQKVSTLFLFWLHWIVPFDSNHQNDNSIEQHFVVGSKSIWMPFFWNNASHLTPSPNCFPTHKKNHSIVRKIVIVLSRQKLFLHENCLSLDSTRAKAHMRFMVYYYFSFLVKMLSLNMIVCVRLFYTQL